MILSERGNEMKSMKDILKGNLDGLLNESVSKKIGDEWLYLTTKIADMLEDEFGMGHGMRAAMFHERNIQRNTKVKVKTTPHIGSNTAYYVIEVRFTNENGFEEGLEGIWVDRLSSLEEEEMLAGCRSEVMKRLKKALEKNLIHLDEVKVAALNEKVERLFENRGGLDESTKELFITNREASEKLRKVSKYLMSLKKEELPKFMKPQITEVQMSNNGMTLKAISIKGMKNQVQLGWSLRDRSIEERVEEARRAEKKAEDLERRLKQDVKDLSDEGFGFEGIKTFNIWVNMEDSSSGGFPINLRGKDGSGELIRETLIRSEEDIEVGLERAALFLISGMETENRHALREALLFKDEARAGEKKKRRTI